jgi:hypothetical protein
METSRSRSDTVPYQLRELCFCGDWACVDGNLETLRFIARWIAACASEPLQGELLALADMCRGDPDDAITVWLWLKKKLLHRPRLPS